MAQKLNWEYVELVFLVMVIPAALGVMENHLEPKMTLVVFVEGTTILVLIPVFLSHVLIAQQLCPSQVVFGVKPINYVPHKRNWIVGM